MKRAVTLLPLAGLFCWLLLQGLAAQSPERPWSLGAGFMARDFQGLPKGMPADAVLLPGYGLHAGRYLGKALDLHLQGGWQPFEMASGSAYENLLDFDALLRLKLANGSRSDGKTAFQPYLSAGIGAARSGPAAARRFDAYVPAGLGFRITGSGPLSLDLSGVYRAALGNLPSHVALHAALLVDFGKGKEQTAEAPAETLPPALPKDSDGDGIIDERDECPLEAGLATFRGCPDRDMDGVPDKDDKCPDQPGLISLQGCPEEIKDQDRDGIPDVQDDCPTVAGLASFKGCPDTDGDGIPDKKDACPDQPGQALFNGCPDTDGDGIPDRDDRCPTVPGIVALMGCPELKQEVKEKLSKLTKAVQFESGKALLKPESLPVLDEIVRIMNEYPEYSMRIAGHTDNVGDDAKNLQLSKDRAAACLEYLVSKGIPALKIESNGYGESLPIADNKTPEGRAANRRVEFELFVK